jgi:type II secretory pathway pseudopilin PulG
MPISTAGKRRSNQRGFTYTIVLVAVVVLGILAEAAVALTSQATRAERETELLFRGMAYRNAIQSYYRTHGHYPHSLDHLVRDNKRPGKRHLRALYRNPLARANADHGGWVLTRHTDGGIRSIASASKEKPLKQANFPRGLERFQNAPSYSEWIFDSPPELQPVTVPVKR